MHGHDAVYSSFACIDPIDLRGLESEIISIRASSLYLKSSINVDLKRVMMRRMNINKKN